jgi:GH15 family glucan-1,4-alpha-glucosidase
LNQSSINIDVPAQADLRDYSLIGNCRSAALVNRHGSIDWCCLPEFDSPALFAALLDKGRGGQFSITPADQNNSVQEYIEDTNVLKTIFTTATGEAELTDLFVAVTEDEKKKQLFPDHEILRVARCTVGTVVFKMEFEPRFYYGKYAAQLQDRQNFGLVITWRENVYHLQATLRKGAILLFENGASAEFHLTQGDEITFSLSSCQQGPAIIPDLASSGRRLEATISFWKNWTRQCTYEGVYKEHVKRSALVLKLLSHAPSGAIIAAPTTSVPEEPGGTRNWDYRYCWLRDASFTVRALLKIGFNEEARAYLDWILHATQLTQPRLQVVYSVFGHTKLKEQNLGWLDGFANSKPVRIGNGAYNQFQLDVYGEVLDAFFSYYGADKRPDRSTRKFLIGLGNKICELWQLPDEGIWEPRTKRVHHTHSKVLAWVGLDRLIKMAHQFQWNVDARKYQNVKDALHNEIEKFGYNEQMGSYTGAFHESELDAACLVFALVGYGEPRSAKLKGTLDRIRETLSDDDFVYRYRNTDDGLPGKEGSFGISNYWLVENLAKVGNHARAKYLFERMLIFMSPTGLLSEELDPISNQLLGNYPQGFSHIGLINAAIAIEECSDHVNKAE